MNEAIRQALADAGGVDIDSPNTVIGDAVLGAGSKPDRDQLEAEARRLGCLDSIRPLLDIIDWCDRTGREIDDLDALVGTRRRDLETPR